ncbi:scarecrow-like protein 27 [Gastrolobium bilobum]|uniref:scarecrow-like protein 27 n=1 Tax=Gastrolobium bilobum TaxID=150636 RepID=UPI002AB32856|nr:scarecrow-like protein 27 [Gastrolobium bilobum]XP_061342549.1 scarecrow-like protein 27 [Gastrolobium bilobum]
MKAVPLPFQEFRGDGVLDFASGGGGGVSDSLLLPQQEQFLQRWTHRENCCYVGIEPTSALDVRRKPSPPTSSSTLSSSHGSGGSCGSIDNTTGVAAKFSGEKDNNPPQAGLEVGQGRCGMGMEEWESVLSESPGQDHSILKLIMGDIEDPSVGLSKLLQSGSGSQDVEFNGVGVGFSFVDQSSVLDPISSINFVSSIDPSGPGNCSDFPFNVNSNIARVGSGVNTNPVFPSSVSNLSPTSLPQGVFQPQKQQQQPIESLDEKLQVLNPQFVLNQNQAPFMQNPGLVLPLTYAQLQEHHHLLPQPPAKRLNCGPAAPNYQVPKTPFLDSGQELFLRRQQQQLQLFPHHLQQRPSIVVAPKQKMVNPGGGSGSQDLATHQLQQAIIDQLFKAAEMMDGSNPEHAHGILARLNQQLSPIGKPFQRAAFYFKEAMQMFLHSNGNNSSLAFSPTGLLLKIGAYKSFSEISPVLQFANFTCSQALLEAVEGFDRIHIVDFDIGFGGQWSSFMQELALRNGGAPALKITAFVSPSHHDEIELSFTHENLKQYADEINMTFELAILSLESLNSASWPQPLHGCEAVVVNLPIGSFSNYPAYLPLVLRFVKQLMPQIVVTLDRSCDRTDAPFPQHLIFALHSYSGLLESLDAVNVHPDVLQMIEKYYLQPAMEKLVLGRQHFQERTLPWKNLLLSSGFSPVTFSNFTESQAECLVQRTPGMGFHVEKRQFSLVLCWQRKDLISVSTWRC